MNDKNNRIIFWIMVIMLIVAAYYIIQSLFTERTPPSFEDQAAEMLVGDEGDIYAP